MYNNSTLHGEWTIERTAEVDTKQNIKTDSKTRAEDRESRGSWEIIPYAKKNNKDAKEITRGGYGFEIKVKTSYTTVVKRSS